MNTAFLKKTGLAAMFGLALAATSCKKDGGTEAEVITTVKLTFTQVGGTEVRTFQFDDPDGDGGAAPTIDKVKLAKGKAYTLKTEFFDKTQTPTADITAEILAEGDKHLVVYAVSGADILIAAADADKNSKPIGLSGIATAGVAGTGNLEVRLIHEPTDKDNTAAPGGTTDVSVTFTVEVQ